MSNPSDKVSAIAANAKLTVTERHEQIRAIDPMGARIFADLNRAMLARESREADEELEQAEIQEGLRILAQLPEYAALDTYERLKVTDSVGATLYFRAHAMQINTESEQRDQALAEMDPGPEAA